MGMSFRELLDCMCPHIPTELEVPKNGTLEKDKFNVALIEAIQKRNKSDSND